MGRFESLFGVKKADIKESCVFLPLLSPGMLGEFRVKRLKRGRLYGAGNSRNYTLINTKMGAGFAGDAVLHLKGTRCRNIILFGSCGLVSGRRGLGIGDLVSPFRCYSYESFSRMLLEGDKDDGSFYANKKLFERFLGPSRKGAVKHVTCATVSSLKLEEDLKGPFTAKGIDVADMECSAFFAACDYAGIKAIALFYITDIIGEKPFYALGGPASKAGALLSVRKAAKLIRDFIKQIDDG